MRRIAIEEWFGWLVGHFDGSRVRWIIIIVYMLYFFFLSFYSHIQPSIAI